MKEKYKLFLSWDKIEYKNDNLAYLINPTLSGPALRLATKINDDDSINLDLTFQYVKTIGSWDISKLKWNRVLKQSSVKAIFDYATLESDQLTKVRYLDNNDYLLIDTEKHEESNHQYNLVYNSIIVKNDKEPYESLKR